MANPNEIKNKTIVYIGKERCDLLYYLTRLAYKHTVLVIDNSISGDFFGMYQGDDEESSYIEMERMTIARGYSINERTKSEYEIIVMYYGMNCIEGLEHFADYHIIAISNEQSEVKAVADAIEKSGKEIRPYYIMRDKVGKKHPAKVMVSALNINPFRVFELGYDTIEYGMYVDLTHSGIVSMKEISNKTEEMLTVLAKELYDLDEGEVRKVIRQKVGGRK